MKTYVDIAPPQLNLHAYGSSDETRIRTIEGGYLEDCRAAEPQYTDTGGVGRATFLSFQFRGRMPSSPSNITVVSCYGAADTASVTCTTPSLVISTPDGVVMVTTSTCANKNEYTVSMTINVLA